MTGTSPPERRCSRLLTTFTTTPYDEVWVSLRVSGSGQVGSITISRSDVVTKSFQWFMEYTTFCKFGCRVPLAACSPVLNRLTGR